ncbi:MAG: DUF1420 family protein [Acidobacteria bacterium]|nr:DUF1420 family protein [Acidobacteriota bacterium]
MALLLSLVTLLGLSAAALGPATDADSLDYHLGVPLDWLRHGGAYPRPDWFHARLVGLGESINLLGLAAGTDCLGAVFQAAGIVVALVAVAAYAGNRRDQLLAGLVVLSCPVLVALVPSQKPQLLPAAALTLALVLPKSDPVRLGLAFGCTAFASACKYSFLLTGGVVAVFCVLEARRSLQTVKTLVILGACLVLFAFPVYARNFVFYGDPLSPFLEEWRPTSDPAVVEFAAALRQHEGADRLEKILRLPWEVLFPPSPGALTSVLGMGAAGFLLAVRAPGPSRRLLLAALTASVVVVVFGQLSPRFFFEPYLWCGAALVPAEWTLWKSIFFKLLTIQIGVVAALAAFAGLALFPGAWTVNARDRVMMTNAYGYAESRWLDAVLPADAVVLADMRSHALLPRPFLVGDEFVQATSLSKMPVRLTSLLREHRVTAVVTDYPTTEEPCLWWQTHYGLPLSGPETFYLATRNPFNRGTAYQKIVFLLSPRSPRSQALPGNALPRGSASMV